VAQFKYLGTTVKNQNLIQEGIKTRLNSGNATHKSVQNLLCSRLLYKNIKLKIWKIIILLVVLCGRETKGDAMPAAKEMISQSLDTFTGSS
jgi:hypothetical protein